MIKSYHIVDGKIYKHKRGEPLHNIHLSELKTVLQAVTNSILEHESDSITDTINRVRVFKSVDHQDILEGRYKDNFTNQYLTWYKFQKQK